MKGREAALECFWKRSVFQDRRWTTEYPSVKSWNISMPVAGEFPGYSE